MEKDSKVIMKPNSGTLVIDISGEKTEAYEGVYQCITRNEHGSAMSNNIVIRQSSKKDTYNCHRDVLLMFLQSPHVSLFFFKLRAQFCFIGSPLWSKERIEPITVQRGMSLVLQCRPPAGLPPPIIFWMDNSKINPHRFVTVTHHTCQSCSF